MDAKYREKLGLDSHKILTDDEIQIIVDDKAKSMFQICDKEEKGFVTKRDMQRLVGELPLTGEELEEVFDLLDDDGNEFMTLEEFNEGFGKFCFNILAGQYHGGSPVLQRVVKHQTLKIPEIIRFSEISKHLLSNYHHHHEYQLLQCTCNIQ